MTGPEQRTGSRAEPDDPPPLLGSWRRLYVLVILELLLCVGLLYALARWAT